MMRSETFTRKVKPHIREEYFTPGSPERVAYEIIDWYITKYNGLPSAEAVAVELTNRDDLDESQFRSTATLFKNICNPDTVSAPGEWLVDQTEKWCKDRALHDALKKSLAIMNDADGKNLSAGAIPKLFQDAINISFDTHVGHDYLEDAKERFLIIRRKDRRTPFDITLLNKMTKGGLVGKTLNVCMAVAGAGKTLFMCHCAANNLMQGKNVLYITLEVAAAEGIGCRIDANLMNVDMGMLESLPEDLFDAKIADIRSKTLGKLIIREFPPRSVGSTQFKSLLNELKNKKGFKPDIIYIDYLNLCVPCTLGKGEHNSYERVKAVSEELRAIAVEYDVPVFSATQTNRTGYGTTDVGMENTSDSMGLPMTADLMFALVGGEELDRLGQYMVQQLKNRYDDKSRLPKFYLGVDKPKMRLYDTEQTSQEDHSEVGHQAAPISIKASPLGSKPVGFKGFT